MHSLSFVDRDLGKLTRWGCTRQERRWLCMKSGDMSTPGSSSAFAVPSNRRRSRIRQQFVRDCVVPISPFRQHRHQSPRTTKETFVSHPTLLLSSEPLETHFERCCCRGGHFGVLRMLLRRGARSDIARREPWSKRVAV
jgi:hypothetical protein